VRARGALLDLRLREVSEALVQIGGLLTAGDVALRARYEGALAELRACLLVSEDDLPRARELLLSSTHAAGEGTICATLLRYIDWTSGARTDPGQVLHQGPGTCSRRRALERILALSLNAALEFEHLRPTVAANLAAEALRLATERYGGTSPVTALPAALLAQVAYEQGRLTEAECLIRPRAAVIRATGVLECVLRARIVLARISVHQSRNDEALALLRDTETIGRMRGWSRLISAARVEQARMLCGKAPTTTRRADLAESGSISTDPWDIDAPQRYSSMQSVLAAVTSASANLDTQDRYRLLMSCLRTGATRGLYRIFVDAGTPLRRLLENLHRDPRLHEKHSVDLRLYIGLLLRATEPTPAHDRRRVSEVHQPLSQREKTILRMIAQGMSNKRIARSLGIAPETVKSHAKRIFLKLGTRTRAQAVARALPRL
jgi:LuxR family transcriptional regulator, maltose regulon positive regulatory protein